jgi:hypothetical protein
MRANLILAGLAMIIGSVSLNAQGTIQFSTRIAGLVDAPVWRHTYGGEPPGPGVTAQLFLVNNDAAGATYIPLFPTTTFREGVRAVQFYTKPVVVEVPGWLPRSEPTIVYRAYEGSSYDEAVRSGLLHGQSGPLKVFLGGTNPDGTEIYGGFLVGLAGFVLVPEPAPGLLAIVAASLFLLGRRTRRAPPS